jgi:hypothetical protein
MITRDDINRTLSKVCDACAKTGRLTWRPCGNHESAADAATCSHELTSYVFTHNGANDAYKCHTCGTMLEAGN